MRVANTEWRQRIDVAAELRLMGREGKISGVWLEACCPLHADKTPSFGICLEDTELGSTKLDKGFWRCHAKCGNGSLDMLIAQFNAWPVKAATLYLRDKYDDPLRYKPRPKAEVKPELVELWARELFSDTPQVSTATVWKYIEAHAISRDILTKARVGCEGGRILKFPIYDMDGNLRMIKEKDVETGDVKNAAGHPEWLYPLQLIDKDKPLVITEGEPDALALHTYGKNAITSTCGYGSWKFDTFGPLVRLLGHRSVVLCPDNDHGGRKAARRLAVELLETGAVDKVQVIQIIGAKDIAEWLAKHHEIARPEKLEALFDGAYEVLAEGNVYGGWEERHGAIYDTRNQHEVVPWTARVLTTGAIRMGHGRVGRSYSVQVKHKSGTIVVVQWDEGDSFLAKLMATPGVHSSWRPEVRYEDKLVTYVLRASETSDNKDTGWCFGYEGEDLKSFWSRETRISKFGIEANDHWEMTAPHPDFKSYSLPLTTEEGARKAFHLVFDHMVYVHEEQFMLPLLATAFCAPIRRLVTEQPRWVVYMIGKSGCGKTSRAALVQSLFGAVRNNENLRTFQDTGRAIEILLHYAGDSVVLMDELAKDKISERDWQAIRGVLQGIAQGSGRTRATRDGRVTASHASQCLVIVTGESLPTEDKSQIARGLVLSMRDLNAFDERYMEHYATLRENVDCLPQAMSWWIYHVLSNEDEVKKRIKERTKELYQQHATQGMFSTEMGVEANMGRVGLRLSHLQAVWEEVVRVAVKLDVISEDIAKSFSARWEQVIGEMIGQAKGHMTNTGLAATVLSTLRSQMDAGRAHLEVKTRVPTIGSVIKIPTHALDSSVCIGAFVEEGVSKRESPKFKANSPRIEHNGHRGHVVLHSGVQVALFQGTRSGVSWNEVMTALNDHGHTWNDNGRAEIPGAGWTRAVVLKPSTASYLVDKADLEVELDDDDSVV